jgi:D-glutamate cyclase
MAIDEIVGDSIDRAVNIEMRFRAGLPRGVTYPLYEAARKKQKKPLAWLAAKLLKDSVKPGQNVFVITGAGTPPGLPAGETDGPPGAAAIARAIEFGLGGKPILISEERNMPAVIKSTEAAGLMVADEDLFKQRRSCALAINFPLGDEAGKKAAAALIKKYKPVAMIFIEKVGPNSKGIYHSIMGTPRTPDKIASAYHLADLAKKEGILTIGIGDGGNEIGCGVIKEAVRDIQPFGKDCGCPCHGGVGTVTECDVLVFAAVSNWGAYAIAAALAGHLGDREVLHDEATELRIVHASVAGGAMDGAYSRLIPYVDGTSDKLQASLITVLHQIIENGLKEYDRGF